jgi:ribulose 1,5-bisphosphate carboxylase large subunit-like protein
VTHGPLIGTIIKPSIGLSVEETVEQVRELVAGGIDFIKDDELQADGGRCPFDERVRAVMRVVNEHAERTGKKVMVAFNLTGDLDQMRRRHDLVLAEGGTCVMAVLNSIGLVGCRNCVAMRSCRSTRTAPAGLSHAQPATGLGLRALAAAVATGRADHMHQWLAQQVQRTGRQRHHRGAFGTAAGGPGCGDGQYHAGVQLRARPAAGR